MHTLKKRITGARRLHAALAGTDPASPDLILVRPAGFHPAFRLPAPDALPARAMRVPGLPAPAAARAGRGHVPAWRHRFAASRKPCALPL